MALEITQRQDDNPEDGYIVYGTKTGKVFFSGSLEDCKRYVRNAKARSARKARESAYKSCGLIKVRGALGGTYWE